MNKQAERALNRFFALIGKTWAHREVAALGFGGLKAIPGLGVKGREEVIKWLMDYGMVPSGVPTDRAEAGLYRRVLIEHIGDQLAVFGYTVVPMSNAPKVTPEDAAQRAAFAVEKLRRMKEGWL